MGDLAPGSVTLAMIPAPFALRDPFDKWYRSSDKLKSIALARISSVIRSHHFICVIRVIFNQNKSRITIHGSATSRPLAVSDQSTACSRLPECCILTCTAMLARHCCCILGLDEGAGLDRQVDVSNRSYNYSKRSSTDLRRRQRVLLVRGVHMGDMTHAVGAATGMCTAWARVQRSGCVGRLTLRFQVRQPVGQRMHLPR